VNDLVARVGPVERSVALKALFAWVDRGVLREETENPNVQSFRLLECVPEDASAAHVGMTTAGSRTVLAEEETAVLTVQQQQAEQMKVFWKVSRHPCRALGTL
jgi:anaphase-promoting complex subunit 2